MINGKKVVSIGLFTLVLVALIGLSCPSKAANDRALGGLIGGGLGGAAIGGLAGGGKGAAIGGSLGAVTGLVLGSSADNAARERERRQPVIIEEEIYEENVAQPQYVQGRVSNQPVAKRRIIRRQQRRTCPTCGCPWHGR